MLEPLPLAGSLKWLWPELVLLVGGILVRLVAQSRDVSWLTPRRLAPITVLMALAASFAVPFEPAAPAGDLLRSDPATILVLRVILSSVAVALLLDGPPVLVFLALAGCLAARASDSLSALLALQFLGLTLAWLLLESGAPGRVASRSLVQSAGLAALAAIGFAGLIGATAQSSFATIGVSLGHRLTTTPGLAALALLPVLVIALGVIDVFKTGALLTDRSVTRTAAVIVVPAGLILLLLRFTGSGLASDVGTTTGTLITTIPWRLVVGLVALGAMVRGTMQALTHQRTSTIVSGLLLAQAGWLLAGVAQGSIDAARAVLVAMITGCLVPFAFRPVATSGSINPRPASLSGLTARLSGLVVLLSLAGSPGTLGFIGRWDLFESARIGSAWWLAAAGSILWGLSILAAIRWYFGSASNDAENEISWAGRLIALACLGLSLAGHPIRGLVSNAFPFP